MATIAQAIGTDVATGFSALLIVIGVLTALGELAAPLRVIVAVLTSIG
jgi:hypothetical protein